MSRQTKSTVKPPEIWRVWWSNPSAAFSVPLLLAGITAYMTDASAYATYWRTAKHFNLSSLGLLFGIAILFVAGCVIGAARRDEGDREPAGDWRRGVRWESVRLLFQLSFALTVLAYAVWFSIAIKNGLRLSVISDLIHGVAGGADSLRIEYLKTIPGVTTATQFGIAVIGLGIPLGAATGWRGVRWRLVTVFALSVLRAFLNSERLAVIELVVPFIVSFIWLCPPTGRRARRMVQAAPFLGVGFLYVFFAVTEYFRSWASFYATRESSYWGFIGLRLMGYYTTALNNGALLYKVKNPLSFQLLPTTVDFIWRFPILSSLLPLISPYFRLSSAISGARYDALLTASANPELTNPSGAFGPIVDYGMIGGLLYWLLCGLICGYIYKECKQRTAAGIFLYPVLFISLIEASRVLYWAEGRFFAPMFLLVVGVLFVFPTRRAAPLYRPLQMDKVPG
jgi:hypothetical protein